MTDDFNARGEFQRLKDDLQNKNENKVSNTLFYWVVGIISTVFVGTVTIFIYILNYEIYRIEHIDNKHQADHDKIIELKTQMDIHKNIHQNSN